MDIIEEQMLAYNAGDLDRFIATYSQDAVIEDGENNVLMRGHEQMREKYGTLFESNPQLYGRILNRLRIGKYTVYEEEVTGSRNSPSPIHAIIIYQVEDKTVHVCMLRQYRKGYTPEVF